MKYKFFNDEIRVFSNFEQNHVNVRRLNVFELQIDHDFEKREFLNFVNNDDKSEFQKKLNSMTNDAVDFENVRNINNENHFAIFNVDAFVVFVIVKFDHNHD